MTIIDRTPVIPPEIPRKPEPKEPGVCLVRAEESIPGHRLHHLEVARERMPLTDLDRFDLYAPDPSFMAMAVENPHLVTTDPSWKPGVTS